MGLNCCLGLIKILQMRLSIDRACLSIDRTRQIVKSSSTACMFLNLDLNHFEHCLIIPIDSKIYIQTSQCSRFANCSKHLEPNKLPLWQFVTKLSYKMKCLNTRTTQYNKMPNYITNPNLRLLTQKLQEEVEGLDQNAPVFPETLNKHITACVERKTYKQ